MENKSLTNDQMNKLVRMGLITHIGLYDPKNDSYLEKDLLDLIQKGNITEIMYDCVGCGFNNPVLESENDGDFVLPSEPGESSNEDTGVTLIEDEDGTSELEVLEVEPSTGVEDPEV